MAKRYCIKITGAESGTDYGFLLNDDGNVLESTDRKAMQFFADWLAMGNPCCCFTVIEKKRKTNSVN